MARPLRLHLPGAFYHVVSRGNARQQIFDDSVDYQQFLRRLEHALLRGHLTCVAYCLMPNHVHLLVEAGEIPVSRPMQHLLSSYAQGFNRRYQRVGHVFQGRFKSLVVDTEDYLLAVVRYIVHNPVAAGLAGSPAEWAWSSYRATAGQVPVPDFMNVKIVYDSLAGDPGATGAHRFTRFIEGPEPVQEPRGPLFLGSSKLAARLAPPLELMRDDLELVRAERFAVRPALDEVLAGATGAGPLDWCMHEAFWRHGYSLRAIADWLDLHPSTVWRRIRGAPGCRPG